MRPLLALILTTLLIGGVFSYVRFADSVRRPMSAYKIDFSAGEYSLEIKQTCPLVADIFTESPALLVRFKNETLFESKSGLAADAVTVITPLPGVELGENELFIKANRPSGRGFDVIQVILKRDEIPIRETLLPSVPGLAELGGPVVFRVARQAAGETQAGSAGGVDTPATGGE